MLLKKFSLGLLGRDTAASHRPAPSSIEPDRLIELMRCFPISGKIRYFPEHRKDIVLESIVIAYGINNQLVYTQNDIHIDGESSAPVFVLDHDWKERTIREVHRFCLLLPYVGAMENDLDYDRRVALDSGGYLQRGEILTLTALSNTARGVPHVNCTVRKRVLLQEGYYANHAVVVLEIQPQTLNHIDQRQQMRLPTNVPVTLQVAEQGPSHAGTLIDFTESSMKIRIGDPVAGIAEKKNLIVTIDLTGQRRRFAFSGRVLRKDADTIVLLLSACLKDDRFRDIELIDMLDFKATLLQHPATCA